MDRAPAKRNTLTAEQAARAARSLPVSSRVEPCRGAVCSPCDLSAPALLLSTHAHHWQEGRRAFRSGLAVRDNPHPRTSDEGRDWRGGWYEEAAQS